MSKVKCQNCEFFDLVADPQGLCRTNPPPWSTILKTDWCGRFQESETDRRRDALRLVKDIITGSLDKINAGIGVVIPVAAYTWFPDDIIAHCLALGFTPRFESDPYGNVLVFKVVTP